MAFVVSPIHLLARVLPGVSSSVADDLFEPSSHERGSFTPEEFDVHPQTGFFPAQPLRKLVEPYGVWEQTLRDARGVVTLWNDRSEEAVSKKPEGDRWRSRVREMPVLSTAAIHETPQLQRAHMVLACTMHFYVHSLPPEEKEPRVRIPRSLAVPLVEISKLLRIAPVLTFADVVLWNWELVDPSLPLSSQNIKYEDLFSGVETERQFYMISAAVELKGVEMLKIFEDFYNIPDPTAFPAIGKIASDLVQLKKIIEELTEIFRLIRTTLDPNVFYWVVRLWWSGAKNTPSKIEWLFEGVPNSAVLDIGGGSAGQSSVMHALDIFLDVDHKLEKKRTPAPSANNQKSELGFMERMRRYMPGKHREYLEYISSMRPTVRDVAKQITTLAEPYNDTVLALKKLRDLHIQIVALYVVTRSGSTPIPGIVPEPKDEEEPVRGTGGSAVSSLLKAGRDATARAVLQ
ncbi:Indoleamine 2,3-dioxygenase [Obba rivulosa]|uniref:Indoleamine 2,3-dioxygenase n=1 Tax=Obba rivulosa TaxID=1052685 RepID=A0A8E2AXG8_9APHY|nr:Indoleamine 2,3-dioxygenase [Obba rivulosa]